jgi:hypothetical protein
MRRSLRRLSICFLAGVAAAGAYGDAKAGDGSGYFRMADNRQEYKHAVALSRESPSEPGKRKVQLYLTTHPVDPAKAVGEFDLDRGITEQLRELGGGMTRITITPEGGEGGLWFWVSEPMDTFNTSGYGKFSLTKNTATRIEGSHVLAEPEDFFDKTYQFDLRFATDVVSADFGGDALPAGGGEPGAAYLAYVKAVKDGDIEALRAHLGDSAEYMLPKDDPESAKSYVETLKYGTPASATVTGGWLQGERAILKIDGKDGDGNVQRGVVLLVKEGGRWREENKDLATVY